MFELAIIDSPWYLDDLLAWMNVALSSLEVGRSVLFVLWPNPLAHRRVLNMKNWFPH